MSGKARGRRTGSVIRRTSRWRRGRRVPCIGWLNDGPWRKISSGAWFLTRGLESHPSAGSGQAFSQKRREVGNPLFEIEIVAVREIAFRTSRVRTVDDYRVRVLNGKDGHGI